MVEEAIPVDPFFIDTGSLQVRTDTVIGCFFFLSLLWNIPPPLYSTLIINGMDGTQLECASGYFLHLLKASTLPIRLWSFGEIVIDPFER